MITNDHYFKESQCIRANRNPGKTKTAPMTLDQTAKQNFKISFEAGPLEKCVEPRLNLEF